MKLHSVIGAEGAAAKQENPRPVPYTHSPRSSRYCASALLVSLAVVLSAALSAARANKTREPLPELTLTICVYNYANAPEGDLRRAEGEARRIIGRADVETIWLDWSASGHVLPPDRGDFHQECSSGRAFGWIVTMRIMNRFDYNGSTLNPRTFGYSNRPALATVLYDRITTFAERNGYTEAVPVLLGDIMAHEIGHLLLAPDTDSPTGIMRGRWGRAQVRRAVQGSLSFTPDESSKIRTAIEVRMESQVTSP